MLDFFRSLEFGAQLLIIVGLVAVIVGAVWIISHAIVFNTNRGKALNQMDLKLTKLQSDLAIRSGKISADINLMQEFDRRSRYRKLYEIDAELSRRRSEVIKREIDVQQREQVLFDNEREIEARIAAAVARASERPYFNGTQVFSDFSNRSSLFTNSRLCSAMRERARLTFPLTVSTCITGSTGNTYQVSLNDCSCEDFIRTAKPCKHMYRLALELGLLLHAASPLESDIDVISSKLAEEQKHIEANKRIMRSISAKEAAISSLISEERQTFPYLAHLIADYDALQDKKIEDGLRKRTRPAMVAAEAVKSIRKEKVRLKYENKLLRYQLLSYESLFPWLESFKELSPAEAAEAASVIINGTEESDEYGSLSTWLSKDEWQKLPDAEKYQLALERYMRRPRSAWAAGVDYERFIGYQCEQLGYRVIYTGATLGKQDMGRDLILTHRDDAIIIQCKRYAVGKEIHENTVFQLYGSALAYSLKVGDGVHVSSAIYTTSVLSDVARSCADRLGVKLKENYPLVPYPMVKCNISKNGEKIYHLPFDQQYDRIHIDYGTGEMYVSTVSEAEAAGFRRAWRWSGGH